jgi:hypothetical protein
MSSRAFAQSTHGQNAKNPERQTRFFQFVHRPDRQMDTKQGTAVRDKESSFVIRNSSLLPAVALEAFNRYLGVSPTGGYAYSRISWVLSPIESPRAEEGGKKTAFANVA